MTRLLAVLAITIFAFFVALYSWDRTHKFECTVEGLGLAQDQWLKLAEKHPRKARMEMRKLTERTRQSDKIVSIEQVIAQWQADPKGPDKRNCRRLREGLARLR